jgi:phosphatidylserine synthase
MPPKRRESDRGWVVAVGWVACIALAFSLTYTFVRTLVDDAHEVDPLFFGMQATASLLFLVYSLKLRNRVFIVANLVAVLNAAGTLILSLW